MGVIRTPLEGCSAPRLGLNVLLAGKPRLIPKLHRPWPGGVRPPARASSSVVPRGVETTTAALVTPSGEDGDASCAPSAVLRSVWASPGEAGACPHSALSRPHPHRFCSSDSSARRRHRLAPHPGLLRHPTQSVYGTERSILVGSPRENSGNNTPSVPGQHRQHQRLVAVAGEARPVQRHHTLGARSDHIRDPGVEECFQLDAFVAQQPVDLLDTVLAELAELAGGLGQALTDGVHRQRGAGEHPKRCIRKRLAALRLMRWRSVKFLPA